MAEVTAFKLYADTPARRARQLAGDLLLLAWVVGWVVVARLVHEATMLLARPGEEIASAGTGLADRFRDAGRAVDGAPLIGEDLERPFTGAGDAADELAAAGLRQVEAVGQLADWLAVSVAAIPVLLACAVYLPVRWRFVRRATAAQRSIDGGEDLDLFALRALVRQPLHRLARLSDDPAGGWRRRDPELVRALALLELRDAGLRPPPG
jgi:hypothetical protein